MYQQTEEDVAAGVLRLSLHGEEKVLPVLKIEASEKWHALAKRRLGAAIGGLDPQGLADLLDVADLAITEAVELIAAYDQEHVLAPSKQALGAQLTRNQAMAILKAILRVEFPLALEAAPLMEYLRPMVPRLLAESLRENSTNGRSPTGDSTPEPSESVSATAS